MDWGGRCDNNEVSLFSSPPPPINTLRILNTTWPQCLRITQTINVYSWTLLSQVCLLWKKNGSLELEIYNRHPQEGIPLQITWGHTALHTEFLQQAIQNDQDLKTIQNSQRKSFKDYFVRDTKAKGSFFSLTSSRHQDLSWSKKMERICSVYCIMSFFSFLLYTLKKESCKHTTQN